MDERGREASGDEPQQVVDLTLGFASMRELQSELAPMLSNDGLFVATDDPLPVDTVVRFRITLAEDFVLIEGTGVVIWTSTGADVGEPGMAVRYVSLAREAQDTIDAVIDAHLAAGGELFALEPGGVAAATFPTDALDGGGGRSLAASGGRGRSTQEELRRARLTVRGEPAGGDEMSGAALDGDDVALVADQVEAAAARLGETGDSGPSRSPHLPFGWESEAGAAGARDELDELLARVAGEGATSAAGADAAGGDRDASDGFEQAPPGMASEDEDETLDVLLTDHFAEAEELAEKAGHEGAGTGSEAGDDVIPTLLEQWDRDAAEGEPLLDGGEGAPSPPTGPAWRSAPRPVARQAGRDAWRTGAPRSSEERGSEARDRAGAVGSPDMGFDLREDDDTGFASGEPTGAGTHGSRWLLLILVIVIGMVAVAAYLGKDRILKLISPSAEEVAAAAPVMAPEQAIPELRDEPQPAQPSEEQAAGEPTDLAQPAVAEDAPPVPETEAPVDAQPEEDVHEAVPSAPATGIKDISVTRVGAATLVVLTANGALDPDAVSVFPMRDPARILVRVQGITEEYPRYEIPAGTPEVATIRIGLHPELRPPALYVVLDLADPMVGAADVVVEGDTARVTAAVQ